MWSMYNPDTLIFAADLSLLIYFSFLITIGVWALRARLPKIFDSKYSRRIIIFSQLPFTYKWRVSVSAEDLPVFERARIRQHVFIVAVSALPLVLSVYAYIHTIVQLWHCNVHGVGIL